MTPKSARRVPPSRWWGLIVVAAVVASAMAVCRAIDAPDAVMAGGLPVVMASPVTHGPVLDGVVETLWDAAEPAYLDLKRGRLGSQVAILAELRAVHTDRALFFLVRWQEKAPVAVASDAHNKLILHFSLPAPWEGAEDTMCLIACHTAYVDAANQGRYVTPETIPPGVTDSLALGGGWEDGYWTLEWGRPLVTQNPLDIQFGDLDHSYPFFVKTIEGRLGEPDPVSDELYLRFERHDE